jgi:putative acetyltransferase
MTFERLPKEQFKPIFDTLMKYSEVYVIEDKGHVVATRRIIPSSGEHAHSVELASFGVDKDHLGKGYGIRFYEFLIDKIRKEKPEVKRIEIGQETDNEIALNLAKKMGFEAEVILPDWIRRKTGPEKYTSKWNMGARFMAFVLDPQLAEQSIANVKKYSPKMPTSNADQSLMNNIKIEIDSENKKAVCYYKDKKLGVCHFAQGVRRFGHIQFWEIKLEPGCDLSAMEACLRKLACDAAQQCKKIEIFIADKESAQLVEALGFHCRGKKTGSCKIGNNYYDEIGVELSFFNIQDAKELLKISVTEEYQALRVASVLNKCQEDIHSALSERQIDQYAALYLENMAFQMIREGLGELAIHRYGQKDQDPQPWHALIQELPIQLKEDFIHLDKLTTKTYVNEPVKESSLRNEF